MISPKQILVWTDPTPSFSDGEAFSYGQDEIPVPVQPSCMQMETLISCGGFYCSTATNAAIARPELVLLQQNWSYGHFSSVGETRNAIMKMLPQGSSVAHLPRCKFAGFA